ncbi:MAG: anti-sigma factor [Rubrobacter sp.]|nr:anti-sigma factor [Rubrobacter sp.]
MNEMNRERFDDLKDAYALGALPEDELRDFEAYLANHPELQSEVDDIASIATLLAITPADQEPPKRLRRSVMAMVNAESESRRERRTVSRWPSFAGLRGFFTPRLALGFAAALVVGLLGWNALLQSEVQNLSGQNTDLQAEIEDARSGAEGSRILAMQGEGEMSGSDAELMAFEGDRAVLVARNMPSIPDDRTLQIWVINDGEAQPSGIFQPGEGPVAAVVEHSLEGAETVAVTVEPEGGSPQPTTDPMLSTQL